MATTNPTTAEEHSAAYREHRERVIELRMMIDGGLVDGMSPEKHRRLNEELQDELECCMWHYVECRRLRATYGAEERGDG